LISTIVSKSEKIEAFTLGVNFIYSDLGMSIKKGFVNRNIETSPNNEVIKDYPDDFSIVIQAFYLKEGSFSYGLSCNIENTYSEIRDLETDNIYTDELKSIQYKAGIYHFANRVGQIGFLFGTDIGLNQAFENNASELGLLIAPGLKILYKWKFFIFMTEFNYHYTQGFEKTNQDFLNQWTGLRSSFSINFQLF
jgi:hypothetical protein